LIGIQDIADNAITAVLKLFGVDFGENGTFLGYLDRKWAELKTSIQTKWDAGVTAITDGWSTTVDAVTNTWTNLTTSISNGWTNLTTSISNTWTSVTTSISNGWTSVTDSISNTWTTVTDSISNGWNIIVNNVTTAWDNVTTAITDGWQNVVDFFTITIPVKLAAIKFEIQSIAVGIYNSVVDATTSMIEVITVDIPNKIGEVKDAIIEKATGLYDAVLTKVNSLIASIVDLIPSGVDIKNGIINAIKALPGGEALLDMVGISYEPTPEKMNTDADFFDQEIRTNKGMSINPMSYPGAQSFGTAYTTTPKERFAELMAFRQPAGTIPAPVIIQDQSVRQGGSQSTTINQISNPVSSMDLTTVMRNQGVRFGHGPYGY
jgi:hypothetical protein